MSGAEVVPGARALMEAFWPGPLTLVLPAKAGLPLALVGATGGVGVRWSPHPVAEALVAWINQRVGKAQRVSGVRFRDSFPRNALGKVLKKELRTEYGQ